MEIKVLKISNAILTFSLPKYAKPNNLEINCTMNIMLILMCIAGNRKTSTLRLTNFLPNSINEGFLQMFHWIILKFSKCQIIFSCLLE